MDVTVGTFNLNNLFTRWNFRASVERGTKLTEELVFDPETDEVRFRRFKGRLVEGKALAAQEEIAARILAMSVDVLAVQEVENIEALRTFNRDKLGSFYNNAVLVEGNDPRLIDVGVLSQLPLRRIVSHQTEPDPANPSQRIFGRDLLQVDVLDPNRRRRLFTVFNTHMKSNYIPRDVDDPDAAAESADARRARQAQVTAEVIKRETRPNSRFLLLGDMNDDPDSGHLTAFTRDAELALVDALLDVTETRPSKAETLGPQPGPRWTSRHKESGQPPEHRLFDQIWVSAGLGDKVAGATIDRRTKHGGDGSDHDPAWITLSAI